MGLAFGGCLIVIFPFTAPFVGIPRASFSVTAFFAALLNALFAQEINASASSNRLPLRDTTIDRQ